MPEAPEVALLRRFRTELQATVLQIEVLTATRNSLMSVVAGLEETLRLKGIEFVTRQADSQRSLLDPPPIISSAIAVMRSEKVPMGAKEIHVAIRNRGFVVNYSTLYKALNREAAKRTSAIRRRAGKFELSESANNVTESER